MHVHGTAFGLASDAEGGIVDTVAALLGHVGSETDGVRHVQVGPNPSKLADGRDHGVVVLMDDESVLEPYRAHPRHPEAGALLRANVERGVGIDTGPMYTSESTATDRPRVHITLFEPDQTVGPEVLEEVDTHLRAAVDDCPGVLGVYVGRNRTRHSPPVSECVVIVTDGDQGFEEFQQHPQRARIAELMTAVVRQPIGLDLGQAQTSAG